MIDTQGIFGLTKEAVELDRALMANWGEFAEHPEEDLVAFAPGAFRTLSDRIERAWRRYGLDASQLRHSILEELKNRPLRLEEILNALHEEPLYEEDFKDIGTKELKAEVRALLKAGLVTQNPELIWILG